MENLFKTLSGKLSEFTKHVSRRTVTDERKTTNFGSQLSVHQHKQLTTPYHDKGVGLVSSSNKLLTKFMEKDTNVKFANVTAAVDE